jgi:hypothetical protein
VRDPGNSNNSLKSRDNEVKFLSFMISTARSSIIIHELQEKGKGKGKN